MTNKLLLTIILVLMRIVSFGQVKQEIILPDSNVVFKTRKVEGVIFGMNFKWRMGIHSEKVRERDPMRIIAEDENSKRYLPTVNKIIQIDKELKSYIQDSSSFIADNLVKYIKQYFGYILPNGDTIVAINCFYNTDTKKEGNWKKYYVKVADGGHFYFGVKYNLTRKKFYDLWINGLG